MKKTYYITFKTLSKTNVTRNFIECTCNVLVNLEVKAVSILMLLLREIPKVLAADFRAAFVRIGGKKIVSVN